MFAGKPSLYATRPTQPPIRQRDRKWLPVKGCCTALQVWSDVAPAMRHRLCDPLLNGLLEYPACTPESSMDTLPFTLSPQYTPNALNALIPTNKNARNCQCCKQPLGDSTEESFRPTD